MISLHDVQRNFANVLLSQSKTMLLPWLQLPQGDAGMQLYVQTIYGTLRKALAEVYPVMQRLLGQRCFDALARRYIHDYPSRSGDLHDFGEWFAEVIQNFPPAKDFPYLPDMARLEWHYHRVFHAANHTPWDHRYLAQFDPAYYGRLRFSLAPACVLFSSLYPVHQIWQANQSGADGSVTLMQQETYLLILRNVEGIEFIPLTPGEYRFLVALRTGQILSDAILQALSIDLAFDPSQVLAQQIARGVLIDVRQDVAYSL